MIRRTITSRFHSLSLFVRTIKSRHVYLLEKYVLNTRNIRYKQLNKETRLSLRSKNIIKTYRTSLNKINFNSLIKEKILVVYRHYTTTFYEIFRHKTLY